MDEATLVSTLGSNSTPGAPPELLKRIAGGGQQADGEIGLTCKQHTPHTSDTKGTVM